MYCRVNEFEAGVNDCIFFVHEQQKSLLFCYWVLKQAFAQTLDVMIHVIHEVYTKACITVIF